MSYLKTAQRSARPLYDSNVTGTSLTEPDSTTTEPSGQGVLKVDGDDNLVRLHFYGVGTVGATAVAHVYTYETVIGTSGPAIDYVPLHHSSYRLTLGGRAGAGGVVGTSNAYVGSIAWTDGDAEAHVISPGTSRIASVTLDPRGSRYVAVKLVRHSTTSINAAAKTL